MKPSRPPKPVSAVTSKATAPVSAISTATDSTRTGPNRPTSTGFSWVIRIMPDGVGAERQAERLRRQAVPPCRMNGAPAM